MILILYRRDFLAFLLVLWFLRMFLNVPLGDTDSLVYGRVFQGLGLESAQCFPGTGTTIQARRCICHVVILIPHLPVRYRGPWDLISL